MIKRRFFDLPIFNFRAVSVADVKEIIMELKIDKTVSGEIPVKLLKDCDSSFYVLTNCINESIENGRFPDILKEVKLVQYINPKIRLKKQITDL